MKRVLFFLGCASLFVFPACSKENAATSERCAGLDAGTPVDPLLLAFLSRARAAHHIADEQEGAGDLAAAVVPLVALAAGPLPRGGGATLAPEVREVLADTHARLADLRSREGAYDLAIADVRAGLESASEPNYFRGHLLETEGLVEERRAKALEPKDPSGSAAARARALSLLEQAMAVQANVIGAAVPDAPDASRANPAASVAPATRKPADSP